MRSSNDIVCNINDTNNTNDLKDLWYNLFSKPLKSIEIINDINNQQKDKYYSLYRYLSDMAKFWRLMMPPPLEHINIKVCFEWIPYEFLIWVELWFIWPEKLNRALIENIEKTLNIELCNISYSIYEITKIYDKNWNKINYSLYPEQAIEKLEFQRNWKEWDNTLKWLLWFKEQIRAKINDNYEISKNVCERYNEILKTIENWWIIDIDDFKNNIPDIYKNDVNTILLNNKEIFKKVKYNSDSEDIKTIEKKLENNDLLLENAYKEQWVQLYNNVLKWGPYRKFFNEEIDIIENNKDKMKKYIWELHIWLGVGDMSKELEIYKQILWLKYLDENPYQKWLDPNDKDIIDFRKSHCFLWIDSSKQHNINISEFKLMWFAWMFNTHNKYFFDDNNCFFSNKDFFKLFNKKDNWKNIISLWDNSIDVNRFKTKSFTILWNTLLNFEDKDKIRLIDSYMDNLWEKTIWLIGIHRRLDKDTLIKLYNTEEKKTWFSNLLMRTYQVNRQTNNKDNYRLNISTNKEWDILIQIELLQDVIFNVWDKKIIKKKWELLNIAKSWKYSKNEFESLIEKTKNAEIIDILKWENLVDIYVIKNNKNTKDSIRNNTKSDIISEFITTSATKKKKTKDK